jgi:hypothetical protein
MNRSRLEPLGVPGSDYELNDSEAARHEPAALDRWLVKQITTKLGPSPVRMMLWDEADVPPREGAVHLRIMDRKALWQLVVNPDLHFGDLYSAGRLEVRGELLTLLLEAYRYTTENTAIGALLAGGRKLAPDLSDSKRNIHHHYDIGNDFYKLWLDREALQYTCAYFADPAMTIEQAQQAKMHHVCRKLQLKPGERVVEAGGGWGGFHCSWRRITACACAASTSRRNRSLIRARGRVSSASTAKSSSSRMITGTSPARTMRSSRSECSSTSARATTRISAR